ncbi:MAG: hypothetical protein JWQ07_2198 [Ramlibacter sp.]|nr:hypothetical protein [Ramlibacter sp.]
MANPASTYTANSFKNPAVPVAGKLLGELFAATPLAIFAAALRTAFPQSGKR